MRGDYGFDVTPASNDWAAPQAQARCVRRAPERHLRAQSGGEGRHPRRGPGALPRRAHAWRSTGRAIGGAHRDRHRRLSHACRAARRRARHHLGRLLRARAAAAARGRRRQRLRRVRARLRVPGARQRRGAVHAQGSPADSFRRDARQIADARNARAGHRHSHAASCRPRCARWSGRRRWSRRTAGSSPDFDCVLWAIGRVAERRRPRSAARRRRARCAADSWPPTSFRTPMSTASTRSATSPGRPALTPVAIAAGRRLQRPPVRRQAASGALTTRLIPDGRVHASAHRHRGLERGRGARAYGDAVKVYVADFTPMYHALTARKTHTDMKLVCVGPRGEDRRLPHHRPGRRRDAAGICGGDPHGRDASATSTTPWPFTRRAPKSSSRCAEAVPNRRLSRLASASSTVCVLGRMPRQSMNDSAACSTSMPQPLRRVPACSDARPAA